jgi:hypothetical protein
MIPTHTPTSAPCTIGRTGQWLSGTAAALLVAFGSVLPASDAQAVIVYSGPVSLPIPVTSAGIYINVVTGATSTSGSGLPTWDVDPWGTTALRIWGNTSGGIVANLGSSTTLTDNLPLGTSVGVSSVFTQSPSAVETTGATSFVLSSTANYIGFSFLNEGSSTVNYGWMQFSLGTSYTGTDRAVLGWAYENTGAAINVGATAAVPEPGSLGYMLAGGLALLALRGARRRR